MLSVWTVSSFPMVSDQQTVSILTILSSGLSVVDAVGLPLMMMPTETELVKKMVNKITKL
jgi:hypothetical protein